MQITLAGLAKKFGGTVVGDASVEISGVSRIEEGSKGTISFLANPKYRKYLEKTVSSAVIVEKSISQSATNLLQVDDPYDVFRKVLLLFHPPDEVKHHFVHKSAIIHSDTVLHEPVSINENVVIHAMGTSIGKHSFIGAGCFIGKNVTVGAHCYIHPGVKILADSIIGERVILHSGVVIGSDGFGNTKKDGKYLKIPQVGNVIVGNDVEIGANTTVDRATIGSTVIGDGCRIDNLVQIAHNVEIGENTAVVAQTGISGSTKIGKNVIIAGQVGIIGHLEIGDNTVIAAQSGIAKDIPENSFYMGSPAKPHMTYKKIDVLLQKLPDLFARVKKLEK